MPGGKENEKLETVSPACLSFGRDTIMLELDNSFWYTLWCVMTMAFICAWVFIVYGCHKMDRKTKGNP